MYCCVKHGWYDYHKTIQMIELNKQSKATGHTTESEQSSPMGIRSVSASGTTTPPLQPQSPSQSQPQSKLDHDMHVYNGSKNWRRFFSMEYILIQTLVPILTKRSSRMVIYAIFIILFILSILSFSTLDTETDVTKLIPDDSHIVDFIKMSNGGWGAIAFGAIEIVVTNRDFSDAQTRNDVWSMVDEIDYNFESPDATFITPVSEWMTDFDIWIAQTFNDSNLTVDDVEDEYYQLLQQFVDDQDYRRWKDKIVFDNIDNPTKIVATRVCQITQIFVCVCVSCIRVNNKLAV